MYKKITAFAFALCLAGNTVCCQESVPYVFGAENGISGNCGENAFWDFDEETGTLTVSGTGAVELFDDDSEYVYIYSRPWQNVCSEIKRIVISEGITLIGNDIFRECWNLESVIIPMSVTKIGNRAFYGCYKLKSIALLNGSTELGENIFNTEIYDEWGYEYTKFMVYGQPLSSAQDYAMLNDCDFEKINGRCGEDAYWYFDEAKGEMLIKGTGAVSNFTRNGQPWEKYRDSITSVKISDDITSVGRYAFFGCKNLKEVTLKENIENIGAYAFGYLDDMSVMSGLTVYGYRGQLSEKYAQKNGLRFAEYTEPFEYREVNGKIEITGFNGTPVNISIPSEINGMKVTRIADEVFSWKTSLKKVFIPEGVEYIGNNAFEGCEFLTDVSLPGSIGYIGYGAFSYVPYVKNIENNGMSVTPTGLLLRIESEDEVISIPSSVKCVAANSVYIPNCRELILETDGAFDKISHIFGELENIETIKYRRPVIYGISDNMNCTVHKAQKKTVTAEGVPYDTYTYSTSYNNGFWSPDALQECMSPSGEMYAFCGENGKVNVIPEDSKPFSINCEGFMFGGATIGDDGCIYVMWGKNISDDVIGQSMDEQNILVSKYDINGKFIKQTGIEVSKTEAQFPFDAGNANIRYKDGVLGVFFNTEWLRSSDGYHHQGAEFMWVDAEKMEIIDYSTWEGSHSFGGSMTVTDDGFAVVQMGDAFSDRGVLINDYRAGKQNYCKVQCLNMFHSSGQYGSNEKHLDGNITYTHMGGMACGITTYAAAGKSERVYTSEVYGSSPLRTGNYDVFVSICDRSIMDAANYGLAGEKRYDEADGRVIDENIIWLTKCNEHEKAGSVKIVSLESGAYCVLWERFSDDKFDSIRYVILDDCGNILRRETEIQGARLSDTSVQPAVIGNKLRWAVAEDEAVVWYTVDLDEAGGDTKLKGDVNADGCVNTSDLMHMMRYIILRENYSGFRKDNADVNGDGKVNIFDLIRIKRMLMG